MIEPLERRRLLAAGQPLPDFGNGGNGIGPGVAEIAEISGTGSAATDVLPDGNLLVGSIGPSTDPHVTMPIYLQSVPAGSKCKVFLVRNGNVVVKGSTTLYTVG